MAGRERVLITVPNGNGWIHKTVAEAVIHLIQDSRYASTVQFPTKTPIENNRNHCVQEAISGGYDWWLSIDSDNPPRQNPLNLIAMDHDIIGFPTPVYHFDGQHKGDTPIYINAMDAVNDESGQFVGWKPHTVQSGMQEVDAVGSGCLLVARRVLESLANKQPFMRSWDDQGRVIAGSDFLFCQKAKAEGFRVWTHYDYLCGHFNEVDLVEANNAFMGARQ